MVGDWLGWRPRNSWKHLWRLELYQIDQLLAEGEAYKSYVTQKKSWRLSVNAKKRRHLAINEYLGMSEEKKSSFAGHWSSWVSSQLFVWLSSGQWYGQRWYRVWVATSVATGLSKKKMVTNPQLCRCHRWPWRTNFPMLFAEMTIANTQAAYGLWGSWLGSSE